MRRRRMSRWVLSMGLAVAGVVLTANPVAARPGDPSWPSNEWVPPKSWSSDTTGVACTYTPAPPDEKVSQTVTVLVLDQSGGGQGDNNDLDEDLKGLPDRFKPIKVTIPSDISDAEQSNATAAIEAEVEPELKEGGLESKPYIVLYPTTLQNATNGLPLADKKFLVKGRDDAASLEAHWSEFLEKGWTGELEGLKAEPREADTWYIDAESLPGWATWTADGGATVKINVGGQLSGCDVEATDDTGQAVPWTLPGTLKVTDGTEGMKVQIEQPATPGNPLEADLPEFSAPPSSSTTTEDGKDEGDGGGGDRSRSSGTDSSDSDSDSSGSSTKVVLAGIVGAIVGAGALTLARRMEAGKEGPGGVAPAAVHGGGLPVPGTPLPGGAPAAPAAVGAASGAAAPIPAPEPGRAIRAEPAPPGWTGAVAGDRTIRLGEIGLNRLLPADLDAGRAWAYEARGVIAGSGWMEKKAGRGEDAEPTLRVHADGMALLGVYDGTGGAGASIARRLRDGTDLTGAYLASRLVRDLVESWGPRRLGQRAPVGDPSDLTDLLAGGLRDEAAVVPDNSGIRGSLSKKLPTTAALLALTPREGRVVRAEAIWAGDSRAFILTPNHGLQVLTVDDTRETDALALIRNDQPMTNVISADNEFRLNHRAIDRDGPAVFLVATDGCFGYVPTPAHFELLILDALLASAVPAEWPAKLLEQLAEVAADDVSFAMVTWGFESFSDLKDAFRRRQGYLDAEHWQPFVEAGDDAAARERFRDASWAVYRETYEAVAFGSGKGEASP